MSKLMQAMSSMMGASKGRMCPDCGSTMEGGECPECGCGEEYDMEEEGDGKITTQSLLDLKMHLHSAMQLIDRLIVDNSDD